jgi:hypothetical protein
VCYGRHRFSALWAGAVRQLELDAHRFEIETLFNVGTLAQGLNVAEAPSSDATRGSRTSHLRTITGRWCSRSSTLRERLRTPPRPRPGKRPSSSRSPLPRSGSGSARPLGMLRGGLSDINLATRSAEAGYRMTPDTLSSRIAE